MFGLADELAALSVAGADDDGECFLFGYERMQCLQRADRGLASLARAVEDCGGRVAEQEFGLMQVRFEA